MASLTLVFDHAKDVWVLRVPGYPEVELDQDDIQKLRTALAAVPWV